MGNASYDACIFSALETSGTKAAGRKIGSCPFTIITAHALGQHVQLSQAPLPDSKDVHLKS